VSRHLHDVAISASGIRQHSRGGVSQSVDGKPAPIDLRIQNRAQFAVNGEPERSRWCAGAPVRRLTGGVKRLMMGQ
jgi:hypothetical protein